MDAIRAPDSGRDPNAQAERPATLLPRPRHVHSRVRRGYGGGRRLRRAPLQDRNQPRSPANALSDHPPGPHPGRMTERDPARVWWAAGLDPVRAAARAARELLQASVLVRTRALVRARVRVRPRSRARVR